ncbi:MAG: acyl-ACP--UDP-N-acetylglucosamine O-acyltransferase [Planctomycetota bacterium]
MKRKPESATRIHPTAILGEGVELGQDVVIGPYCIIDSTVRIGDRTRVHSHAQILNHTSLGADNVVYPGSILGGIPQDRKFEGEETELCIGDRNVFREHCTVHLGTAPPNGARVTRIGHDNLIMAGSHVAHDCRLEDRVTLGNNVLLAGHVQIESHATIGGATALHQFTMVGTLAYIGGMTRVALDVPPFVMFEGTPARLRGLNLVGLKRFGMRTGEIASLKEAYRLLFHTSQTREAGLTALEARSDLSRHVRCLVESLRRSNNGIRGRYLESLRQGHDPGLPAARPHGDSSRGRTPTQQYPGQAEAELP